MPGPDAPTWTVGRQTIGNVLPLAVSAPVLVAGLVRFPSEGVNPWLLAWAPTAWLATNLLGLSGSWGLKKEASKRLHLERPFDRSERWFVGFARPGHTGLLDPHEDVGLLLIHPDRLEFLGAQHRVELGRADVTSVGRRPNPHTWLLLGGWVAVEGSVDGHGVRLLVEPRERPTLLGNRQAGRRLAARLKAWVSSP